MMELSVEENLLADFELSLQKAELFGRQLLMGDLSAFMPHSEVESLDDFVTNTDESGFELT